MEEKAIPPRRHAFHAPWSGYLIATLVATGVNVVAFIASLALVPSSKEIVAGN